MRKETKQDYLQIRITETEKKEIKTSALANGFDTISDFILWLFRKFGKINQTG